MYFFEVQSGNQILVKKIDLSRMFDETCHDIVDFVAKEQDITKIRKQHPHNIPPGVFNLNTMNIDYDSDQKSFLEHEGYHQAGSDERSPFPSLSRIQL
jgi:hypothetical protein